MKTLSLLSLRSKATLLVLSLFWFTSPAPAQNITTTTGNAITVTVSSTVVRDHAANPMLLGFGTSWMAMQTITPSTSNLWDSGQMAARTALTAFLKTDFTGAVYRYGSSYLDWDKVVGPMAGRVNQHVGATEVYYPVQFGVDEFLRFVESVQGTPLLFLNLYAMNGTAITTDAQWATLKQKAVGWLEYCNAPVNEDWNNDGVFQGQLRSNYGHPAPYNVMLWEMDNELDTTSSYTQALYVSRCQEVIALMKAKQPNLTFIAHARTAPWGDVNWRNWHNAVLSGLGTEIGGISWHAYYDGYDVPAMGTYTDRIWSDATAWAVSTGASTAPGVYITEHAKWPSNLNDASTWPRCTSIIGALSVTDMIISNVQKPHVQLAINHALTANSPWALFTEIDPVTGNYVWGATFAPRPLAYAMKLTHRVMQNADILSTAELSPKTGTYVYDVRATGYQYGSTGAMGVYLVNRATNSFPLTLSLPGWTSGNKVMRTDGVGGPDGSNQIWKRYIATTVNTSSQTTLKAPAQAILNALAIGPNIALNGDFELGTLGSTPSSWEKRLDSGVTGTTSLIADSTGSVNGTNIVRLQKTTGTGYCCLVQPSWSNTALGSTGLIASNTYSSYVLRANVRTSALAANSVKLKVQCFKSGGGYVSTSPVSAAAPIDTAGLWTPMELEFIPVNLLQDYALGYLELVLLNNSATGYVDVDGVTLLQRKNWAQNPTLLDANANNLADYWENRIPDGSGGQVLYSGSTTPRYVTLSKTAGNSVQFVQTYNSDLGSSGVLNARQNEKWRLRARVRYTNLDSAGAQLKVQYFNSTGTYITSSPTSTKVTGTNTAWSDLVLEFSPRDLIGATAFGRAEIMVQDNSNTGSIDVCYLSLEVLD